MRKPDAVLNIHGPSFLEKLHAWAATLPQACWLNGEGFSASGTFSKQKNDRLGLFCAGIREELVFENEVDFTRLDEFIAREGEWKFGYLSYDLKNSIEKLSSDNQDRCRFPLLRMFIPDLVVDLREEIALLYGKDAAETAQLINQQVLPADSSLPSFTIRQNFSEQEYHDKVRSVLRHIQLGDVYELNFCLEFFAEDVIIEPWNVYRKLNELSGMPFSCLFKEESRSLICASPERFMRKEGRRLYSQPMKGTAKRTGGNNDQAEQLSLKQNAKERAENIMIVDLVRNDLAKIATRGSVQAEELCGVYSYRQVHQMVSTVSAELKTGSLSEILRAMFPMGSMTGAPKIRAMQLIEHYEETKRGIFSGAAGYVDPDGNFDFNVVIRSMVYNAGNRYLSYQAGSAITSSSDPEKEYQECQLKAKALFDIFQK